ncbi:MAG: glycosyltransferase family 87 protein [Janthinobacterium lividum]
MTENEPAHSTQPAYTLDPKLAAYGSIILLGLLTWLLLSVTYSGAVSTSSGITGMDFKVFYPAAVRLNQGQPLYQPNLPLSLQHALYCYTPLPAELLRPLGHLSFDKALKFWFFINAGGLILAIALYGSAVRLAWRDAWLLGILLLISFRFWDNTLNFGVGQSNDLLLGFVGGMLWADSRGRWGLMGALIVVAALFKVWLIGMLLYLVLRRQWKPLIGSIAGFIVSVGLSFALVGFNQMSSLLRVLQESKAAQEGQEVQSSIIGFANISLHANRFVTPFVNSEAVYLTFIALCTATILAGFVFLWRVLARPSPLEARLAFGVTLASILLLLPTYENGYFVYCFPLLWTLLVSPDADWKASARMITPARLMLVGGVVIYLIFSRSWPFFTPFAPSYQHGLKSLLVSMKFFGTASLWVVAVVVLRGLRMPKVASSQEAAFALKTQAEF